MNALLELPLAPRSLTLTPPLSDEEFEALARSKGIFQLERTKDGEIRMNPPTGLFTGHGNSDITYQLRAWWKLHRKGMVVDSNAGFFLPDGSMLSPDGAYISPDRLKGVTRSQAARLLHRTPNFIIELLSASDHLQDAKAKMDLWLANGVDLAWLIDPFRKQVQIYQPGSPVQIESGLLVKGIGPVEGFHLDLAEVWSCYDIID